MDEFTQLLSSLLGLFPLTRLIEIKRCQRSRATVFIHNHLQFCCSTLGIKARNFQDASSAPPTTDEQKMASSIVMKIYFRRIVLAMAFEVKSCHELCAGTGCSSCIVVVINADIPRAPLLPISGDRNITIASTEGCYLVTAAVIYWVQRNYEQTT